MIFDTSFNDCEDFCLLFAKFVEFRRKQKTGFEFVCSAKRTLNFKAKYDISHVQILAKNE